jgi:hypothetical protein
MGLRCGCWAAWVSFSIIYFSLPSVHYCASGQFPFFFLLFRAAAASSCASFSLCPLTDCSTHAAAFGQLFISPMSFHCGCHRFHLFTSILVFVFEQFRLWLFLRAARAK